MTHADEHKSLIGGDRRNLDHPGGSPMNEMNSRVIGRLEGKMDAVMSGVEAVQTQVADLTRYQHSRNHELANGIDSTRGEIVLSQRDISAKIEARDAEVRHALLGIDHRVTKIEANRKAERAFMGGISAAISMLVVILGMMFELGGSK